MARPKSKTKKILFAVEIIVLLLFIGGAGSRSYGL